ncbi:rhamnogalacturonan acetylesterase [Hephaestia mangrovi]|uniref:rhamnogalacturonan acetylesterase n=1 Tax=Hephaestia mangrovi TaxID=2873268 RepID=UPI001CA70D9C|nr:rhamnogalacturonan acetylesterase [Hephaestia mangrovi]MBY8829658.1 rhamnogalacturonan acetylesterase [Hephaestia mangrovi]
MNSSWLVAAATLSLVQAAPPTPPKPAPTVPATAKETRPRIFIASDSTAARYTRSQYPQMGWGMFLQCMVPTDLQVIDMAHGGRSTKTYVSDGFWQQLLDQLKPGDTVLIQFGHNDEDTTKMYRHVDPPQYAENLTKFVADVRARQGEPILITPIARDEFNADGTIKETHGAWAQAVHKVAADTHTPLIDLDARAQAFFGHVGAGKADRYYMIYTPADHIARFPQGHHDTTHLNELGARVAAVLVGQGLKSIDGPLAREVHTPDPATITAHGSPTCW